MTPRAKKPGFSCSDCKLGESEDKTGNCIFGIGTRRRIMVIVESIKETDAGLRQAASGDVGRKLGYLFDKAKIKKDHVFITAAIKCPVAKGKKPTKASKDACISHLREEIEYVKPAVIITMGSVGLSMLLPKIEGATKERGFRYEYLSDSNDESNKIAVIPTLSADQATSSCLYDRVIVRDFQYANRILKDPSYKSPSTEFSVKIAKTTEDLAALEKSLLEAPSWSFDLETQGLDFTKHKIICASFSFKTGEGHVLPFYDFEMARSFCKRVFASKARKTAQNGKFDVKFLRAIGVEVEHFDFDTMIAHHLIDGAMPFRSLTFLAQWFGLINTRYDAAIDAQKKKHGKDDYSMFDRDTLFEYAGIDAAVTFGLRSIFEPLIDQDGVRQVFEKISMPLIRLLADMEYRGAHIDKPVMVSLHTKLTAEIEQTRSEIADLTKIEDFNPASPAQVKKYIKSKRVALKQVTVSGAESMDKEVLESLKGHRWLGKFPDLVLRHRTLQKICSTYLKDPKGVKGLLPKLDQNSYLHTNFNIHGTNTGRLSSDKPNLQNVPRAHGIRELFIPDETGDLFLGADYKQLEVRVAAAISKDPVLIAEVLAGVDMHSRNAATFLLNMDEAEFVSILKDTSHEKYAFAVNARTCAKSITFGVLYGSTAFGVAKRENIDVEYCEKFIQAFFSKYRVLSKWIARQHKTVEISKRIVSPTGRFYHFDDFDYINSKYCMNFERKKRIEEVYRNAVNLPIQSYGSDIFSLHKLKVFNYLQKHNLNSRLVLTIHDGFIINLKPSEKNRLVEVIPKIMRRVLNKGTRFEVPVEVDLEVTDKWLGK